MLSKVMEAELELSMLERGSCNQLPESLQDNESVFNCVRLTEPAM